jgi:hypothetical protein
MFDFASYDDFRKFIMYVKYFDLPFVGKLSIIDTVSFLVNLLVFPAIFFQMSKTWALKETTDFPNDGDWSLCHVLQCLHVVL